MLKLSYTDLGVYLEHLDTSLEAIIADRVMLSVRLNILLHVETSRAALLLPTRAFSMAQLKQAVQDDPHITLNIADAEFVEVSFCGTWIAEQAHSHNGIFLVALSDRAQLFLCRVWQASQSHASSLA